jgi:hypothetical protein
MRGSFHGPGGRFEVELLLDLDLLTNWSKKSTKRNEVKRIEKEGY